MGLFQFCFSFLVGLVVGFSDPFIQHFCGRGFPWKSNQLMDAPSFLPWPLGSEDLLPGSLWKIGGSLWGGNGRSCSAASVVSTSCACLVAW